MQRTRPLKRPAVFLLLTCGAKKKLFPRWGKIIGDVLAMIAGRNSGRDEDSVQQLILCVNQGEDVPVVVALG